MSHSDLSLGSSLSPELDNIMNRIPIETDIFISQMEAVEFQQFLCSAL